MIQNLKKKIELSKLLGEIETNFDSIEIVKKLDSFHSKSKAHVIGITGSPGVGKSSLIDKLVRFIRKKKKSVGIIAIDPSSEKSGGALLGDRTRFLLNPLDNEVFVRSMASKSFLGGVSELTYPSMIVMRSIFDFLIIETVGVGQSETFIKDITDSVVLCIQPGSGDTIQFMKSGIFEIPDIIVVTKSDINNLSDITFADLSGSKQYFQNKNDWEINIVKTSSSQNIGFDQLYLELLSRWKWLNIRNRKKKLRIKQDLKWIENNIVKEFGDYGLRKIKNLISYKKDPFKTLRKLKDSLDF
jgi:LAO/AO transport system kinase